MSSGQERWPRITRALFERSEGGSPLAGLCSACRETLSMSGAGITLIVGEGVQASLCASDPTVTQLAELEFTLGNGPAADAYQRGTPILEVDLVKRPPTRWAGFTGPAVEAGIRAIFAFPLRLGAARLGALTLYQDHGGAISDDTFADALITADVITRAILVRQADLPGEALIAELIDGSAYHAQVHQASGMVSVQLDVTVADALAVLRARSFALGRPLRDLAADIVARRLRLDD